MSESMSTGYYALQSVERLIKLLVERGVITEADRKQIHEDIVAEHSKGNG